MLRKVAEIYGTKIPGTETREFSNIVASRVNEQVSVYVNRKLL